MYKKEDRRESSVPRTRVIARFIKWQYTCVRNFEIGVINRLWDTARYDTDALVQSIFKYHTVRYRNATEINRLGQTRPCVNHTFSYSTFNIRNIKTVRFQCTAISHIAGKNCSVISAKGDVRDNALCAREPRGSRWTSRREEIAFLFFFFSPEGKGNAHWQPTRAFRTIWSSKCVCVFLSSSVYYIFTLIYKIYICTLIISITLFIITSASLLSSLVIVVIVVSTFLYAHCLLSFETQCQAHVCAHSHTTFSHYLPTGSIS